MADALSDLHGRASSGWPGSGLGCPRGLHCTPTPGRTRRRWVCTGSSSFGDRLYTFVLTVVAVLDVPVRAEAARRTPKLFRLALLLLLGIPVQAVVGSVLVHLELHPLRRSRYFLSAIMIALSHAAGAQHPARGPSRVAHDQRPASCTGHTTLVRRLAVATGVAAVVCPRRPRDRRRPPRDQDSARLAFSSVVIARAHAVPVLPAHPHGRDGHRGGRGGVPAGVLRRRVRHHDPGDHRPGAVGCSSLNGVPEAAVSLHMVLSAVLVRRPPPSSPSASTSRTTTTSTRRRGPGRKGSPPPRPHVRCADRAPPRTPSAPVIPGRSVFPSCAAGTRLRRRPAQRTSGSRPRGCSSADEHAIAGAHTPNNNRPQMVRIPTTSVAQSLRASDGAAGRPRSCATASVRVAARGNGQQRTPPVAACARRKPPRGRTARTGDVRAPSAAWGRGGAARPPHPCAALSSPLGGTPATPEPAGRPSAVPAAGG
ncbi:hypothetical protein QJS66_03020 [Kocuria rhizophila]|nr:hypothetical protein QJS66_03020 [Kocuria rhizophila]